ncbi:MULTISPECIES: 4-hydroxy-tetrahydrodipicolinate synthase [Bacillaceae]|uniref:4-hydroxy-tetrahydrodipicolinate synthase n=1 Tax=Bacillaceae TaxID=186817 RepID=UPI001E3F5734|nr:MULTISPECIES: 4-hydroxy-tetrahydrodipicolinate synthase [Bacillaceae]MCE4047493.1 4-hydroxy-tetrahydrodipicolinate synthase [Bacillus sp. Au-Bac7]MDL0436100.1 4-hydroxy-tetrahydrodipicolinate synthase [Niallia sp. SS-2023]UPO86159.1 4-hydroxy-tetrahydrodipicolinate synthase [Niallia sp. Man26]
MELKGIIPAMLTPLTIEQKVNDSVTRQLTNHLLDSGVHGLFILGTNGEFHLLNKEEKLTFAKIVIEEANGRVPVIVGTGGNSTEETIDLSQKMEQLGADALSVITPFFISPSQAEMAVHFEKVAKSTSLPILLYNIPARTGVNLEPETVSRLAKVPNIVGIKDSSGNFANIENYINATKDEDFSVFAGTDSLILQTLQAGGKGAVAATANMVPDVVVAIYDKWLEGNIEAAKENQEKLQPLRDTFKHGTLPSVLKKAVELYSVPVGPPKMPVSEVSGDALEIVTEMVEWYKQRKESIVK